MKKPVNIVPAEFVRTMYAVIIRRKDGTEFFSSGKGDGPAMFYRHADARAWQRELSPHLTGSKTRVRKVQVTMREA